MLKCFTAGSPLSRRNPLPLPPSTLTFQPSPIISHEIHFDNIFPCPQFPPILGFMFFKRGKRKITTLSHTQLESIYVGQLLLSVRPSLKCGWYICVVRMYLRLYNLLQWYLLIHIHCCSIHYREKLEIPKCLLTGKLIMKMWYIYIIQY